MALVRDRQDGTFGRSIHNLKIVRHWLPTFTEMNVSQFFFVADKPYFVAEIRHVIGDNGASASDIMVVRKCTSTEAPAAGVSLASLSVRSTTPINTVFVANLDSVSGRDLNPGDRLATQAPITLTAGGDFLVEVLLLPNPNMLATLLYP